MCRFQGRCPEHWHGRDTILPPAPCPSAATTVVRGLASRRIRHSRRACPPSPTPHASLGHRGNAPGTARTCSRSLGNPRTRAAQQSAATQPVAVTWAGSSPGTWHRARLGPRPASARPIARECPWFERLAVRTTHWAVSGRGNRRVSLAVLPLGLTTSRRSLSPSTSREVTERPMMASLARNAIHARSEGGGAGAQVQQAGLFLTEPDRLLNS
jgi:hypothetical protein